MKRGTKFGVITALTVIFTIFGAGAAMAADEPTGDVFLDLFGQTSESCAAPSAGVRYNSYTGSDTNIAPVGTLIKGTPGNTVTLSGNISENSALVVSDASQSLLDTAGAMLNAGESIIWSGDIALASGHAYIPLNDRAQLSIYVGENYNGTPLKLVHLRNDGTSEVINQVVRDGYISVITDSLSPFGIIADAGAAANTFSDSSAGTQSSEPSAKPTVNAASSETLFPWLTPTLEPVASEQPSESVSQKPQTTVQSSKTPSTQAKPTQTSTDSKPAQTTTVKPSTAPTSTKIPAVDQEPEVKKDGSTQKTENVNTRPAEQTSKTSNEESKVTITDVPKTDDETDAIFPYIICMAASAAGVLAGARLLQKPVKRKRRI